jgi:integrase
MGNGSSTRGVTPLGDRIQVGFTYQGTFIRPTLDLKPTAANLKHAARLRAQIIDEIENGTFQLAEHFPDYRFAERHTVPGEAGDARGRTLRDWFTVWLSFASREKEHSTLSVYRDHMTHYWLSVWGDLLPGRLSHEMILKRLADLSKERFDEATGVTRRPLSRKTQNNILIPLRGTLELACRELKIRNPVEGVKNVRTQRGNPDPFPEEEVALIVADIRVPRDGMTQAQADAWADYYLFAGAAGLRPSEQIALQWQDVDFRKKVIHVCRAMVLGEEKDRTKTFVARDVELLDAAWEVIERQKERTHKRQRELGGLIFANPSTNRAWASTDEQRKVWVDACERTGVRYRPPKELRDTSISSKLAAGADPYWVASQHGHSLETMMRDYAKFIPNADKGRNRALLNAPKAASTAPA